MRPNSWLRSGRRHTGRYLGLFNEYGSAQRLDGRRSYIHGWGRMSGSGALRKGMQATMDDDLSIWLTMDLVGR
jgi:hypothetical protein